MAKVEVTWFEITTRTTELEVDGFEPDSAKSRQDMRDLIVKLSEADLKAAVVDNGPITIESAVVLREGELAPEIKPAKQREDMF